MNRAQQFLRTRLGIGVSLIVLGVLLMFLLRGCGDSGAQRGQQPGQRAATTEQQVPTQTKTLCDTFAEKAEPIKRVTLDDTRPEYGLLPQVNSGEEYLFDASQPYIMNGVQQPSGCIRRTFADDNEVVVKKLPNTIPEIKVWRSK